MQFGVASFFETPKGSPWAAVGVPSPSFIPQYNYLDAYKRLKKDSKDKKEKYDPRVALEKAVTDQFFRESEGGKNKAATLKARTTAWALTYYLANNKLDGLLRYYKELAKLPRDLEFDNEVLLACFARAFDLTDGKDPKKVNRNKLDQLARDWDKFLDNTPLELADFNEQVVAKVIKEMKNPPANNGPGGPGRPGAPGGLPPGAP